MYCRKCGTEQHLGQKFCPKCGESFLDENGNPYLKGVKKDIQDVKYKVTSNVEEFSKQGKKFIDETIHPLVNDKIEILKSYHWKENKEWIMSYINDFLNNSSKVRLFTKVVVCIFLLWLVLKNGLSLWSIVIGFALIFGAFKGLPNIKKGDLKSQYLSLMACIAVMFASVAILPNGKGLFHSKSVQEEFIESIKDPSTSYAVRIDRKVIHFGFGSKWVEVPIDSYPEATESYIYNLIFFPENESSKFGKAIMRIWDIKKKVWIDGIHRVYLYAIRDDGIIEIYNGYLNNNYSKDSKTKIADVRLYIEKENELIQLRGLYQNKERLFKRTEYTDAVNKETNKRLFRL